MAKKPGKVGENTDGGKGKDFAGSGVEGNKAPEKTVITGEDVLKALRAKGVKI